MLNLILLSIGWVCSFVTVSVYIYTQRGWWRNQIGRMLIATSSCVGLFFLWYFIVTIYPGIPARNSIRTILFLATTIAVVYTMFAIINLTRITKRDRELFEWSE